MERVLLDELHLSQHNAQSYSLPSPSLAANSIHAHTSSTTHL